MKERLDVDRPQVNQGMNKLERDKKRKNAVAVEQKTRRSDRGSCESAFRAETMARLVPQNRTRSDSSH